MILFFGYIILVILCIVLTMYFLEGSRDDDPPISESSIEEYNLKIKETYDKILDKNSMRWRTGSKVDDNAEWISRGK